MGASWGLRCGPLNKATMLSHVPRRKLYPDPFINWNPTVIGLISRTPALIYGNSYNWMFLGLSSNPEWTSWLIMSQCITFESNTLNGFRDDLWYCVCQQRRQHRQTPHHTNSPQPIDQWANNREYDTVFKFY